MKEMRKMRRHLETLFGITVNDYEIILKQQNSICALCGRSGVELHVDFDYKINKVRGLICANCFLIICKFGSDLELLEKAALYLKGQLCTRKQLN